MVYIFFILNSYLFFRCSVDPFLFENFDTKDGDFLTAKFRAFKFPDSTYVQFRGTVNACIDKCKGIPCSNGQIGYGRRKREIPSQSAELEFSMSTIIRVVGEPVSKGKVNKKNHLFPTSFNFFFNNFFKTVLNFFFFSEIANDLDSKLEQLKVTNQKLQRNSRGSVFRSIHDNESALIRRSSSSDSDEPIHIRAQVTNSASKLLTIQIAIVSLVFSFVRLTQQ